MISKIDAIRFAMGYSSVRAAYRSSCDGLAQRGEASEKIVRERWGLSPEEEPSRKINEQGFSDYDVFWEQVGEVKEESDAAIEIVREAFVIALFHFWERQSNRWTGRDNYDEAETFLALEAIGRHPQKAKLNLLMLLANCLKHGKSSKPSGACNKLYERYSDLFQIGENLSERPSDENILLPDGLLDDLFQAVVQSGPPSSSHNESWLLLT